VRRFWILELISAYGTRTRDLSLAMAMIRKEGGYYGDSDSAIALLVRVQKGVSETRRSWMCFD